MKSVRVIITIIYHSTHHIFGPLRLRNNLYCVGWGVKLYSLTHPVVLERGPQGGIIRHLRWSWIWEEGRPTSPYCNSCRETTCLFQTPVMLALQTGKAVSFQNTYRLAQSQTSYFSRRLLPIRLCARGPKIILLIKSFTSSTVEINVLISKTANTAIMSLSS